VWFDSGQFRKSISNIWPKDAWPVVAFLTAALLLLFFGDIAEDVAEGEWLAFDRTILLALRVTGDPATPIGPVWFQEAARDVTAMGSVTVLGFVTVAACGYLVLASRRSIALFLLLSVAGGYLVNDLLKFGFDRARPDFVVPSVRIYSASFPSGHASLSAVTYLTLAILLARGEPARSVRLYFIAIALGLTLVVGLSRVYLGVHYPTDVLAGWCFGSAWALGARLLAERWHIR
jgi:undecaprenyl-diphosphatase